MAVFTPVPDHALEAFLAPYDIGSVLSCRGIAEGWENSNFHLVTTTGSHILTLFEKRVKEHDLPFFIGVMEHLARRDIPCPLPMWRRDGSALGMLVGRPAVIVSFLDGLPPRTLAPTLCHEMGRLLARLHRAGADYAPMRANDHGQPDWPRLVAECGPEADQVAPGLAAELARELTMFDRLWPRDLPRGLIHGDAFPDNTMVRDKRICGIFDFYFACEDLLAYDLAICLNAWCFESDGVLDRERSERLLAGYHQERPLDKAEVEALPILARGAALRFLTTRLQDWLAPAEAVLVTPKDPREYLRILRFHQEAGGPEAYGWR